MTATVNGVRLAYRDTGRGLPLLCLHGGMGVDAATLHVSGILDLAKFGVRVIIPDQRGHGQSGRSVETAQFAAAPYNAAFTRELPAYDVRERVARLAVRTLLIVGRPDPYRVHMEWLARHMPNATLRVLDDVGHFPFIEAPDEFTQSVAGFMNSRGQSAV